MSVGCCPFMNVLPYSRGVPWQDRTGPERIITNFVAVLRELGGPTRVKEAELLENAIASGSFSSLIQRTTEDSKQDSLK